MDTSSLNDTVCLISGMNDIGKFCLQYDTYCEFDLWYEMILVSFVSSMRYTVSLISGMVWMILVSFVTTMKHTVSLISGMNNIGKFYLQYETNCEFDLWYEWSINSTVCLISGMNDIVKFCLQYE